MSAKKIGMKHREAQLGYAMVLPSVIIIAVFALYPIVDAIWLSLHEYKINMPALGKNFIGLQNYGTAFHEIRFYRSLWNTTYFTVISVFFELVFGLAVAILMNRTFVGRGMVRASVLIPWAIPTAITSLMWKFMFNDQYGVINDILQRLGFIKEFQPWLGNTGTAMTAIVMTDVWKTTPFMALLLLAGLQVISRDLYEAAKVDGASTMQQFWKITLPLLKPAILVALLFRTLDAFRIFDLVFVMTGGGPGNSTETLSMYAQTTLMRYLDFGYGSALSVLTFLCVLLISMIYIKFLGARASTR